MKSSFLLLCTFISCLHSFSQQSNLQGVVSIQNSETETGKRQYVSNAQVEDNFDKAQPVLTNNTGQFKLVYVGIAEKAPVSFQVKKSPLQVVNIDALNAITGQNSMVRITMALPDKIAEYRKQIYKVGKTEAEKRLENLLKKKNTELNELKKASVQNAGKIRLLTQELSQLEEQRKKIDQQAQELSTRYAPVNLDDATPLFKKAFLLFQQGLLDSAQQVLQMADLPGKVDAILLEKEKVENIKEEVDLRDSIVSQRTKDIIPSIQLKADLHKTNYEFDSASDCYKLLMQLKAASFQNIGGFAKYLLDNKQFNLAGIWSRAALMIAADKSDSADAFKQMAFVYHDKNEFNAAIEAYQKSINTLQQLAPKEPRYKVNLARSLISIGTLYADLNDYAKAEKVYQEALAIFEQLDAETKNKLDEYYAAAYTNLGNLHYWKRELTLAENNYKKALQFLENQEKKLRQTAPTDAIQHGADLRSLLDKKAVNYSNLGMVYDQTRSFTRAKENLEKAVAIHEQLAKENPFAYEQNLADSYYNLSNISTPRNYLSTKTDIDAQEAFLKKALAIYLPLHQVNPEVYDPKVARIYHNLGVLYTANNDAAEMNYKKAIEIYQRLVKKDAAVYEPRLADSYWGLGFGYAGRYIKSRFMKDSTMSAQEMEKMSAGASNYIDSAFKTYEQLAAKKPIAFEPKIAERYLQLGTLGDTTSIKKALAIFQRYAQKDAKAFLPKIAEARRSLAQKRMMMENYGADTEAELKSALQIYQQLAKEDGEAYERELAQTYSSLVSFYITKRYTVALVNKDVVATAEMDKKLLELSKQEVAIRERLAAKYPAYEPELAVTYMTTGSIYLNHPDTNSLNTAKEFFTKALDIYKKHPDDLSSAQRIELINTYLKLLENK